MVKPAVGQTNRFASCPDIIWESLAGAFDPRSWLLARKI
jgi:hypothetical protein